ncbi:MAG TPA: ABC transporter substrate-binding protein [Acidisphaera sp.]|nr:ABC transporter substrate-binding protein [Acidisphaera sp.]
MTISRRTLVTGVAAGAAFASLGRPARAQGADTLKIGVLTDLSGPYKDIGGPGSVACANQAIEDFGASGKGMKVEVVSADHQNKTDVGSAVARQWYDRDGVDIILDIPNSGVALAVSSVAREKNKIFIGSGPATSDLTGAQCSPNTIHWTYDTYMLAKSTGGALVKAGGTTWYFITADYAFGKALQRDTTTFIEKAGGKVVGSSAYPFPGTSDFSSLLLQAQSSGAKVLGLANAGADTINSIKQAHEFGLPLTIAGLLVFISDVHSLGLETAQGLTLTSSFYWDHNDHTRAFADRVKSKMGSARPGMVQAGVYSSTLHYLKTAAQMGVAEAKKDGAATVAAMKRLPVDDDCFGKTTIREDGRCLTPAFLWKVKKPSESKGPWDYYTLLNETPGDEAYRPLSEGNCKLVHA